MGSWVSETLFLIVCTELSVFAYHLLICERHVDIDALDSQPGGNIYLLASKGQQQTVIEKCTFIRQGTKKLLKSVKSNDDLSTILGWINGI
jgi:hypothetical protein